MPSLFRVYFYLAFIIVLFSPTFGAVSTQLAEGVEICSTLLINFRREPIFWMPKSIQNSAGTFEEQYTSLIFLRFCYPVTRMFAPPMKVVKL